MRGKPGSFVAREPGSYGRQGCWRPLCRSRRRLPVNVGHAIALDLAMRRITTEFVAVLDVDAMPVSPL